MTLPRLEARHLCRAFGPVKAVDDVSLSIDAGQVVVLLGQSGSGKSTLLRILAGLEGLDAGEVLASGEVVANPTRNTPPEQRGLGMVFQDYALFPHLSALDNVAFGLTSRDKGARQTLAREWLDKVGLSARAAYFPHQLSGGEQQRVALARALAPAPHAVLMDEPFSGLDPQLRDDLQRTMLTALREAGVAALIVSHDSQEAIAIGDVIAIMDRGEIIQTGSPEQVYRAPVLLEAARALGPVWTCTGDAEGGRVVTSFGTFTTSHTGNVIIAARPEATRVLPNPLGVFTVTDRRGVGRFVSLTLQSPSARVSAHIAAADAPPLGAIVDVALADHDAMIFKA
jgi:iron(III) transport system ATP-binding protein